MQLPMKHACAVDPYSRGESGWCPDGTSTPGAWRHAGVQFLLSGVFDVGRCARRCAANFGSRFGAEPARHKFCTHWNVALGLQLTAIGL